MLKKILITLLEIALIALVIYAFITATNSIVLAEDLTEAWVICQPDDYINVRMNPSKRSQPVGYAEAGDKIMTDMKVKNGFLRCYGIGEMGVGWIHKGYVIYDEPERIDRMACSISRGRVACRRWIKGNVRAWLKNCDDVLVYWWSFDWCVTNKGFVQTKYLEMEGV